MQLLFLDLYQNGLIPIDVLMCTVDNLALAAANPMEVLAGNANGMYFNLNRTVFNGFFQYYLNYDIREIMVLEIPHNFNYDRQLSYVSRLITRAHGNMLVTNGYSPGINNIFSNFINNIHNINNSSHLLNVGSDAYNFFRSHIAYCLAPMFMFGKLVASNRFTLISFLLLLQAKPVNALNIQVKNILVSTIGVILYLISMTANDLLFRNFKPKLKDMSLIHGTNINYRSFSLLGKINYKFICYRLGLGLAWLITINIGVFFSTSMSVLAIPYMSDEWKIGAILLSYALSTVSSWVWIKLAKPDMVGYNRQVVKNSCLRGLAELVTFTSLSFANFLIWDMLIKNNTLYIPLFLVGLIPYFISSYFQIVIETGLEPDTLKWYGLIYNIVFTSLSLTSSALYSMFTMQPLSLAVYLIIIITSYVIILLFPMDLYRYKVRNSDAWKLLVRAMLYQLIMFYGFAIGTFATFYFSQLAG